MTLILPRIESLHQTRDDSAEPPPSATSTPLDTTQARLLRRIHRGEDIRRSLSRTDRELTLPALINAGHVTLAPSGRPQLSDRARVSLNP